MRKRATKPVAASEGITETSGVTKPIREALEESGYFVMRLNSGVAKIAGRRIRLCPKGTADLVLYLSERLPIWIETKTAHGRDKKEQAENQARFREKVESLGHTWIRATCLEDVLRSLPGNLP